MRNGRGQNLGHYDPKLKVFTKHVRGSKHFYRKLQSWNLDYEVFMDPLLDDNAMMIYFDDENGLVYTIYAMEAYEVGTVIQEEGYEKQMAIPREYWKVSKMKNE